MLTLRGAMTLPFHKTWFNGAESLAIRDNLTWRPALRLTSQIHPYHGYTGEGAPKTSAL
jgi:hypothetical protein